MAVRTTPSDRKGSPSDRWRGPTLAERARQAQAAQTAVPISSHLTHASAVDESVATAPEEESILIRVPRKFVPFLNPEFVMSNATTANATTAAPKSADTLRAELSHLDSQRTAVAEQLTQLESTAPVVAAATQNGKRNVAKTVGKVAGAVGVTGVVLLGGYYAWRWFRG